MKEKFWLFIRSVRNKKDGFIDATLTPNFDQTSDMLPSYTLTNVKTVKIKSNLSVSTAFWFLNRKSSNTHTSFTPTEHNCLSLPLPTFQDTAVFFCVHIEGDSIRKDCFGRFKKVNKMMGNGDLERGGGTKGRNNAYPPRSYAAAPSSSVYYVETSEKQWTSWLVPMIVVANVAMFIVIMFVNNCPNNDDRRRFGRNGECVARFLGRLSFQPLRENPLFGPSSST